MTLPIDVSHNFGDSLTSYESLPLTDLYTSQVIFCREIGKHMTTIEKKKKHCPIRNTHSVLTRFA